MTKLFPLALFLFSFRAAAQAQMVNEASETAGIDETHSGGPLDMKAPTRLILRQDATAQITLNAPAGVDLPLLVVNVGTLSAISKTKAGRLVSTYTLPEKQFPQVAIIAAVSKAHTLLDWIAIPLYGEARIMTKTEPHAKVEIRIGDTLFGPAIADVNGRTKITILVPPGVVQGVTEVTDKVGNHKRAPLELGVPPFSRIIGICPRMGDRIVLLVVDPHGNPEKCLLHLQNGQHRYAPAHAQRGTLWRIRGDRNVAQKSRLDRSPHHAQRSRRTCRVQTGLPRGHRQRQLTSRRFLRDRGARQRIQPGWRWRRHDEQRRLSGDLELRLLWKPGS